MIELFEVVCRQATLPSRGHKSQHAKESPRNAKARPVEQHKVANAKSVTKDFACRLRAGEFDHSLALTLVGGFVAATGHWSLPLFSSLALQKCAEEERHLRGGVAILVRDLANLHQPSN